ncbi:MAG: radical SAM protein [Candidatus Gracilibacteria bacterium]|nr:radical SAM protein [Candidatus Gracilibacteria bacterium]
MKNITLIQPRHNYAPQEGFGHIYLSAPLLSFKARLLKVLGNTKIDYLDANFSAPDYSKLDGIVGINLVGAPYIPEVLKIIEKLNDDVDIILGGQIISSLTEEEFYKIFNQKRKRVINGNIDKNIEDLFGLEIGILPKVENINLIKSYQDIQGEQMKLYLEREFSLYLSQGCKYNCSFCQAVKGVPEIYRDFDMLKQELIYLSNRAKSLGIHTLKFYLSNLDILQTPNNFEKYLYTISEVIDNTGIKFDFRGLCGVESFLDVYNNNYDLLIKAKNLGLTSIGFGIDGATPEVWKSIGKGQNYKSLGKEKVFNEQEKSLEVIKLTSELGITPETLMVFGHPGETDESLKLAYEFSKEMYEKYGSIPRPHISKTIIPGAKAWYEKQNQDIVNSFIENPEYFQALDYTALPSELTHSDTNLRRLARKWYKKICNLDPINSTKYIIPDTPVYREIAYRLGKTITELNLGKFDR